MTLTDLTLVQLNSAYQKLTGNQSSLTFGRRYQWECWCIHPRPDQWGLAELELVIAYIKRQIWQNKGRTFKNSSLEFGRLIGDPERFQDLLGTARAEARQPKPNPRTEILAATGRPTRPQTTTQTAGVALERTKLAQQLREWKEQNL